LIGAAAAAGVMLVAVGIVYLTVACEDLPGILGPHPGDDAPRTPLGVVAVLLGLAAFAVALAAARRLPPSAPAQH
jgi:drug/metabolite transporter (DMT)-like permease